MKKLTNNEWLQIKTDYQLGLGIRALERKYDVPASTIKSRQDRENWNQDAYTKVQALQANLENLAQEFTHEQLPYVKDKLDELLDLKNKVQSFLSKAIDINLMNLEEVTNEPDLSKRIKLMSMMRANMSDLANIYPTTVKEADKEEKQEDKVINLIME